MNSFPRSPIQDSKRRLKRVLFVLVGLCLCIELVLQLADFGVFKEDRLRSLAYEYGGFWPGLLNDWTANYPLQPYLMFLTYGFLHSGLVHLTVNMITLWSLGVAVLDRVGVMGFCVLYTCALLGGGLGFAFLAETPRPMVGASGALFGLAGGLLAWLYVDRFTQGESLLQIAQAVFILILLNLVLWWAMNGQLAWETHLGGFVSGWLVALLIDPRARYT